MKHLYKLYNTEVRRPHIGSISGLTEMGIWRIKGIHVIYFAQLLCSYEKFCHVRSIIWSKRSIHIEVRRHPYRLYYMR
jgi:hypothetical protein